MTFLVLLVYVRRHNGYISRQFKINYITNFSKNLLRRFDLGFNLFVSNLLLSYLILEEFIRLSFIMMRICGCKEVMEIVDVTLNYCIKFLSKSNYFKTQQNLLKFNMIKIKFK